MRIDIDWTVMPAGIIAIVILVGLVVSFVQ